MNLHTKIKRETKRFKFGTSCPNGLLWEEDFLVMVEKPSRMWIVAYGRHQSWNKQREATCHLKGISVVVFFQPCFFILPEKFGASLSPSVAFICSADAAAPDSSAFYCCFIVKPQIKAEENQEALPRCS